VIAEESRSVQLACRLLEVTRSGYYAAASRPPSARSIRHAWLTDLITQIHAASRSTYGVPLVHAELRLGVALSATVGNALDSYIFLALAFGSQRFFLGQFIGKGEMIALGAILTLGRRRPLPAAALEPTAY
jgi:hypothetical protein